MLYNQSSLGLPESSYTTVYIRSFGFIYTTWSTCTYTGFTIVMQLRLLYKTGFIYIILNHLIKYLITDSLIFRVRLPLLVSFHTPAKAFDNTKKDKTRFVALITLFSFKEFFIVSVFKILLLNYSRSRSHGIRKKCR